MPVTDEYIAVQNAMDDKSREVLLATAHAMNPQLNGADVADVLEIYDPLYWIRRENPTIFAVARAIVEGGGGNPDARVPFEGPAPVWTDNTSRARAALKRTAIMLRVNGFMAAATFLDSEAASRSKSS